MNKDDFIKKVGELTCGARQNYSSESWEEKRQREAGFKEAIEQVTKLAFQLDIEGLTVNAYNLFKEQADSMVSLYRDVFEANKKAHELQIKVDTLETVAAQQREEITGFLRREHEMKNEFAVGCKKEVQDETR